MARSIWKQKIEKNDTALATTLNEFPTVDEVNEALDELKNNMVNMDNLYTKEEGYNKYSTKSMVYDLQQFHVDNYMSKDQVQANYYEENDCDSKFAMKTQIIELAALEQNGNQGRASSYTTKAELLEYRKLNDISYHNN